MLAAKVEAGRMQLAKKTNQTQIMEITLDTVCQVIAKQVMAEAKGEKGNITDLMDDMCRQSAIKGRASISMIKASK
jgi:hypothetical protein